MINANEIDVNMFAEEVLQAHNIRRIRHGAPPLQLDEQLSEQSQQCAQELLVSENNDTRLSSVGENICILGVHGPEYTPSGEHTVNFWYQQRDRVVYGREPFSHRTYNFTQLVWQASQLLGVGIARSEDKVVIVCHYMPPGNILGEFLQNVWPEVEEIDQQSY